MKWKPEFKPYVKQVNGKYGVVFPDPNFPKSEWPFVRCVSEAHQKLTIEVAIRCYYMGKGSRWQMSPDTAAAGLNKEK